MKSLLIRLMPAALLCLALTACGGGGAAGQTPYDPETAAQALLDSGAFCLLNPFWWSRPK